jgi:peptide/nickel transport system substrate-binding protein
MSKQAEFVLMFVNTFILRHRKSIIWGIILGFFATLFFLEAYPYYLKLQGQKMRKIGIIGRYTEKNLPLTIQKQLSFGLTALTPSGEATSSLAKNWEVDAKGLSFTFHLYPDLVWHDGVKFTAKDVQYKLKDVAIKPRDDTTLEVTLKDPYAPLPVLLSAPILKPNLVGLGIYKAIRLIYSGDWISELTLSPLKNDLPPLIYKFYPNTDDAVLAFKKGEVNELQNIPQISDFISWKNVKTTQVTFYDRYVGIFFNLENSLFKEKEIRQALAYAIPDFTEYEKAYSPISPQSWAYSQKIRLYKYDPEAAVKILSKSPLATSSNQLTISTYASLLPSAQQIVDAWKKVGVTAKVKVENSIPDDYQVLLISQAIPADPDQYQYWQSTQDDTNITHYSNLKIDKLLEDGRKTYDQEKRKKIYADFQRYLVDDPPVLFLYFPKVYNIERK